MRRLGIVLVAVLVLLVSGLVGAYGPWEPEVDEPQAADFSGLEEVIQNLEAAVELADRNRSAHPDFLADLFDILAELKWEAQMLQEQCQAGAMRPDMVDMQPGRPQYWEIEGTLTNDHQRDRYAIEVHTNGDLFITVTTGEDLNLYGGVFLLDADGETRIYGTNQGPGQTVEHHVHALTAGTYFIEIVKDSRGFYHGPYWADIRLQPFSIANASGSNWTKGQAYGLLPNATVSGHLGQRGQGESAQMESWYRIDVPENGHVTLTVTTSGGTGSDASAIRASDGNLNLYGGVFLLDPDGETRVYGTNQGPGQEVAHEINALRAGTYYVRIAKDGRNFYWGTYTLRVTNTPFSRPSDPEPNDSPRDYNIGTIQVRQTVTGDLGTKGQGLPVDMNDYWRYEHPGGGLVFEVETSGGEKADAGDGNLNLYGGVRIYPANDLDRRVFSTAHHSGTVQQYEVADLPQGTYFFQLEKDGRGFYWGTYALTILQAGR